MSEVEALKKDDCLDHWKGKGGQEFASSRNAVPLSDTG